MLAIAIVFTLRENETMARKIRNDGGATATASEMSKAEKTRLANAKAAAKRAELLAKMVFYPGLNAQEVVNNDGVKELQPTEKIVGVPTDFDSAIHKPIEASNFKSRADWYDFSANQGEKRIAELRQKAADIRAGKVKEPSAKKFDQLQKRFDELTSALGPSLGAELAKSGIDLSVLTAKIKAMAAERAATVAATN